MEYEWDYKIENFIGRTIKSIDNRGYEVILSFEDGKIYKMYHSQDCCESVNIEGIDGDLSTIIGNVITFAEETNPDLPVCDDYYHESFTWTYYTIGTDKGEVTFRWLGVSNGYYSEVPTLEEVV